MDVDGAVMCLLIRVRQVSQMGLPSSHFSSKGVSTARSIMCLVIVRQCLLRSR